MNRVLVVLLIVLVIPCCNKQSSNEESSLKNNQPVKRFVSSVAGLNLRENFDMKSKIITTVSFGKEVTVLSESGDELFLEGRYGKWCNISFENKTGWVFSGFLCKFNPNMLKSIVGSFYREDNKKDKASSKEYDPQMYKFYTTFSDNKVKIKMIIDKYILVSIPDEIMNDREPYESEVIWVYDEDTGKFNEELAFNWASRMKLFYLNKDEYPDAVVQSIGCCGGSSIIYLGSKSGFQKHISIECDDIPPFSDEPEKYGQCGETKFVCNDGTAKKQRFYTFDCTANKIVLSKEVAIDMK